MSLGTSKKHYDHCKLKDNQNVSLPFREQVGTLYLYKYGSMGRYGPIRVMWNAEKYDCGLKGF